MSSIVWIFDPDCPSDTARLDDILMIGRLFPCRCRGSHWFCKPSAHPGSQTVADPDYRRLALPRKICQTLICSLNRSVRLIATENHEGIIGSPFPTLEQSHATTPTLFRPPLRLCGHGRSAAANRRNGRAERDSQNRSEE